jgi:polysaccharide deacetylase 2 family uncharacterized protein YibQ
MKALAVAAGIVFWTLVLGVAWLAFFPASESGEAVAILQIEPATAPGAGGAPATAAQSPDAAEAQSPEESGEPAAEATAPADATPPSAPAEQASKQNTDFPPGFAPTDPSAPQAPVAEPGPGQMAPTPQAAPEESAPPAAPEQQQGAAPAAEEPAAAEPAAQPEEKQAALENGAAPPAGAAKPASPPLPAPSESETGSVTLPEAPVAELVEESQYGPLPKVASDGRRPVEVYARPSKYASVSGTAGPARVAVLVVGLGLPDSPPGDVLKGLPPPVSIAYGAYGRSLQDAVTRARANGHEVLLQVPLEPEDYPKVDPGPHTLLTTLPPEENMKRLQWLMSRYTGYVGITNQMGAKFEATQDSLAPVLEELKSRGLLFVDDGSTPASTAGQIATTIGLDYSVASVQIDVGPQTGDVAKQLAKLEAAAKERGAAIAVVKAKPATIKQLAEWASKLEGKGIVLVPVSAVVRSQRQS